MESREPTGVPLALQSPQRLALADRNRSTRETGAQQSSSPAVRKVSSWLEHGLHQSRSTYPLHCPIRVDDAATVEIACASSGEATDFH